MKKSLLAFILLFSFLLTACASGTTDGEQRKASTLTLTDLSAVTEEVTEAVATGLDLYATGNEAYKIVRPDSCSSTLMGAFKTLRNTIKEKTGTDISVTTDWLKTGTPAPEYEILIGNTCREESAAALEKLEAKGWIVCVSGKKIVINATKDKFLEDAVAWFCENYISDAKAPIPQDLLYTNVIDNATSGEISILFVGNSLTQDGIAYLPYILEKYYPGIDFKFYMWYIGGAKLSDSYSRFVADENCDIFSVCNNTGSWKNSQKKMSQILKTYTFDIVCMQEYFNYRDSYTDSDLAVWNNCHDYIVNNYAGGNELEFISLFHAPKRDRADSIYDLTVSANKLILSKTVADDIIPIGMAVKLAMGTELAKLGDVGNLSPDETHTQEGLPCLVQTYVALIWLLDRLYMDTSIDNLDVRITDSVYNSINVPGANLGSGVITGTDEENKLAKEIAVKAWELSQKTFEKTVN